MEPQVLEYRLSVCWAPELGSFLHPAKNRRITPIKISCFIGFLLVDGFWLYQVYMQFGNPIFPYYNNFFHSPYIPRYSFNLSPGLVRLSWDTYLFMPFYLAAQLNQFTTEIFLRETRFAIVAILLIMNLILFININSFMF